MDFKSEKRQAQSRKRRYTPTTSRAFLLVLDTQAAKRIAARSRAKQERLPHDPRLCSECAEAEYR